MSKIEKMALDNKAKIKRNMQTIQKKMDMLTDKSLYLSDVKDEDITICQQGYEIKKYLVEKNLGLDAWSAWSAWDK